MPFRFYSATKATYHVIEGTTDDNDEVIHGKKARNGDEERV